MRLGVGVGVGVSDCSLVYGSVARSGKKGRGCVFGLAVGGGTGFKGGAVGAAFSVVGFETEDKAVVDSAVCESAEVDDILVSAVERDSDPSVTATALDFLVSKDDWRDVDSLEGIGSVGGSSLIVDAEELSAESNSSLKCELLL